MLLVGACVPDRVAIPLTVGGLATHPAVGALRTGPFRRYLLGQLPSITCSWAQVVALSWVVVELDPRALGWVLALQFMPSLLLGPWFGAVTDRHDRKRLLILAEAGLGLAALSYALASASGVLSLPVIFLLATAWGIINALDTPARQALVPMLVPPEQAASASALTGTVLLLGMTLGSALGAALIAAGPTAAFAINAASFCGDALLLATIRVRPSPRVPRAPGQIRAALRYVWHTPTLRTALLVLGVTATFSFSLQASVPVFVLVSLHGAPSLVGLAFTVTAAGMLAGTLTAAFGAPSPRVFVRAPAAMAAALTVTAFAPSALVALPALAAAGFAWAILLTAVIATLQTADPAMTGRVMATLSVVLLGGLAAGAPIASTLITLTDPRTTLAFAAASAGVAALLCHSLRWTTSAAPTTQPPMRMSKTANAPKFTERQLGQLAKLGPRR